MKKLFLISGSYQQEGWKQLEQDAKQGKADVLLFDRDAWALIFDEQEPAYPGMKTSQPENGLYVAQTGNYAYVVDQQEVHSATEVVQALGPEAIEMLEKIGDGDLVLQRLGRAF